MSTKKYTHEPIRSSSSSLWVCNMRSWCCIFFLVCCPNTATSVCVCVSVKLNILSKAFSIWYDLACNLPTVWPKCHFLLLATSLSDTHTPQLSLCRSALFRCRFAGVFACRCVSYVHPIHDATSHAIFAKMRIVPFCGFIRNYAQLHTK